MDSMTRTDCFGDNGYRQSTTGLTLRKVHVLLLLLMLASSFALSAVTMMKIHVEIDTRSLGNNFTCMINSTIWFHNGTTLTELVPNVFLGNFFVPVVEVVSPNGYEVWTGANDVTWNAWDLNEDEELTFEVLVSSDSGVTFQLLFAGMTETRFLWDCSTFLNLSTYVVEVRVSDGIFSSYDVSDAPFRAGEIGQPDTTTTTTTMVEEIDPRVIMFLAVLIISSGFIAFVVYYASKSWV